jgi:hypothetical protein
MAGARDPSIQEIADKAVRRLMDKGALTVNHTICYYVEHRLWSSSAASDDLIQLARRVIMAPADTGRNVLAHPLTSSEALSEDETQRTILLQDFIDSSEDPEALVMVARNIANGIDNRPSADASLPILQRVLTRLDPFEVDRLLFDSAWANDDFADALAWWLTTKRLPSSGKLTKLLKKQVKAGETPQEAVRLIRHKRGAALHKERV